PGPARDRPRGALAHPLPVGRRAVRRRAPPASPGHRRARAPQGGGGGPARRRASPACRARVAGGRGRDRWGGGGPACHARSGPRGARRLFAAHADPQMTTSPTPDLAASIVALAREQDLALRPSTLRLEEAGLDFRVAFADAEDGTRWVLRIPRRPELAESIAAEAKILAFVRARLPVAVPEWRVHGPRLVAYPRLPGAPGLTLDPATKAPIFHVDPTSEAF